MRRPNRPLVFGDASDFYPSERVRMVLSRFESIQNKMGHTPVEYIRDERGAVLPNEIGRVLGALERGAQGPPLPYHDLTPMVGDEPNSSFGVSPLTSPAVVDDIILAASQKLRSSRGTFPPTWSSSSDEDSDSSWGEHSDECTVESRGGASTASTEGVRVPSIRGTSINDSAVFTENHVVIVLDMSSGALEVSSTGQVLVDRMHTVVASILEAAQQVVDIRDAQYKQALEHKDKQLKKKRQRNVSGELASLMSRVWHPNALVSLFIAGVPFSSEPTNEEMLLRYSRNGTEHYGRPVPSSLRGGAHTAWVPPEAGAIPLYPAGVRVSGYGQAAALSDTGRSFVPTMQPIFASKSIREIASDPTITARIAKAIHAQEQHSRRVLEEFPHIEWPATNIASLIERSVTVVPYDSNTSYSLAIVSNFANQSTPEVTNLLRGPILAKGVILGLYSLSRRIDWSSPDLSPLQSLLASTGGYNVPFDRILAARGDNAVREAQGKWLRSFENVDCLARCLFLKRSSNIPVVMPYQRGNSYMPEEGPSASNPLEGDVAERIWESSFMSNSAIPMAAMAAARLSEGWSVVLEVAEGRAIHRITAYQESFLHRGSLCLFFEATLINAGIQNTIELRAVVQGSPHAVVDLKALARSAATQREFESKGGRKQTLVAIYSQFIERLRVDEGLGTVAEAVSLLPGKGQKPLGSLATTLASTAALHSQAKGCSVAWAYRMSVRHVPLVATIDEKCHSLFFTEMDQTARLDVFKHLVGQFEVRNSPLNIKEIVHRGSILLVVKDPQQETSQLGSGALVQFFLRPLQGENGEDLTVPTPGSQFALSNVLEVRFSFLFVAVRNQASIVRHVMRLIEECHTAREAASISLLRTMPSPPEALHLFMSSYLSYQSMLSGQTSPPQVCNVDVFSSQSVVMLTWTTVFSVPCRTQREYQGAMHALIRRRLSQGFKMMQYTSCGTWALLYLADAKGRLVVVDALHSREWSIRDAANPFSTAIFLRRYYLNFPEVSISPAMQGQFLDYNEDYAIQSTLHSAVVMLGCIRTGVLASNFFASRMQPLHLDIRLFGGVANTSFNLPGLLLGVGAPNNTPFQRMNLPIFSLNDETAECTRVCCALRDSLCARLRAFVVTLRNCVSDEIAFCDLPPHLRETFVGVSRVRVVFCKVEHFDDQAVILIPLEFDAGCPFPSVTVVVSQFTLRTVSQGIADQYGYCMPHAIPDHQAKGRILRSFHTNATKTLRTVAAMLESMYVVAHAAELARQFEVVQGDLVTDLSRSAADRLSTSTRLEKAAVRKALRSDLFSVTSGMSQYHADINVSFYSQSFHFREADDGTPLPPPELEDLPLLFQRSAGLEECAPLIPLVHDDVDGVREVEVDASELVARTTFLVAPSFLPAASPDTLLEDDDHDTHAEDGTNTLPVSPCSPRWYPTMVRFMLVCPNGMWWLCPGGVMKPIPAPVREQDVCTDVRLRVVVVAPPRDIVAFCRHEPHEEGLSQDVHTAPQAPTDKQIWSLVPTDMEVPPREQNDDQPADQNTTAADDVQLDGRPHPPGETLDASDVFSAAGKQEQLDTLSVHRRFQSLHAVLTEDLRTLPCLCLDAAEKAINEILHRIALAALTNVRVACMHETSMRVILPSVVEPALRISDRFDSEEFSADVPCFYLPPLDVNNPDSRRQVGVHHMPFHQHLAGGNVRWGDLSHAGLISTSEVKEQSHRTILELLRDYVRKYSMMYCLASGAFVFSEPQNDNHQLWALVDLKAGHNLVCVTYVSLGPRQDDSGQLLADSIATPLPEHEQVRPIPRNLSPRHVARQLYEDLGEAIRATTMKVFLQYLKRYREAGNCEVVIPKKWGMQSAENPPSVSSHVVPLTEGTLKSLRDRLSSIITKQPTMTVMERHCPSWMMGKGTTVLELNVHPTLQPRKLLHLLHNSRYLDPLRIYDRKGCFLLPDEAEGEEDLWHYIRVLVVPQKTVAEPDRLAPLLVSQPTDEAPQRYKIVVHLYSSFSSPNVRNAISDIADCYYGIAVADVLQGISSQQRREELSQEDFELLQRNHLKSTSQKAEPDPFPDLCPTYARFHLALSMLLGGFEDVGFRVCRPMAPVVTERDAAVHTVPFLFESRHIYLPPSDDGGMGQGEFPITLNTCVDMVGRTVRLDLYSVARPHHAEEKAKVRRCQQGALSVYEGVVQELAFLKGLETPTPNHPLPQVPHLVANLLDFDEKTAGKTLRSVTLGGASSSKGSHLSGRINTCHIHSVVESIAASLHALRPIVVTYDSATQAVAPLGDFAWHRYERWQSALHTSHLHVYILCGINLWMAKADARRGDAVVNSSGLQAPKGMRQAGRYAIPAPVFEGGLIEGLPNHRLLIPTHVVPCRSSVTNAVPPPFAAHSLGVPASQSNPVVVVRVRVASGDVRVACQGLADHTHLMTTAANVVRNALSKGRMFNSVLQQSLGLSTLPKVLRKGGDDGDLKAITEDNLARMCCGDTSKVRHGAGVAIASLVTRRRASRLRFPPSAEREYYEAAADVRKALAAPPPSLTDATTASGAKHKPQMTPLAILSRLRSKQPVISAPQAAPQALMPSKEALHQVLLLSFLRIIVQGLTNRGITVNYCFPYDAAVKCLFDDGRRAVEDYFRVFSEGVEGTAGFEAGKSSYSLCDAVVEQLIRSRTLLVPKAGYQQALYRDSRRVLTNALSASKENMLLHVPNANVSNLPHDACVVHNYHRHLVRAHMLIESKAEREASLHRALQYLWRHRADPSFRPQLVAVTLRLQALSRLHYASRVPDFTLRSDTLTVTPELAALYSQKRVHTNPRGAQLLDPVQFNLREYAKHVKQCFPHTFEMEVRHEDNPPGRDGVIDDRLCNRCGIVPVSGESEPALFTPAVSLMIIPIRTVLNPEVADESLEGGVFLVEVGFNYVNYALDFYIPSGGGRGITPDQSAAAAGEIRRRVVFSSIIYDLLVQHACSLVAQRRAVLPGQQNLSDALRNILSYFPTPPRLSANCLHAFTISDGLELTEGTSLVSHATPQSVGDQPRGDRIRFVVPQHTTTEEGFSFVGLLSLVWAGSVDGHSDEGYNVKLFVLVVDNKGKGTQHMQTIHEGDSGASPALVWSNRARQRLLDLVRDSQHQEFMDGLWEGQFAGGVFSWPKPPADAILLRPFAFPITQMYSRYLEGSMVYIPRPEPLCEELQCPNGIRPLLTIQEGTTHSWQDYTMLRRYVIVIEHDSSREIIRRLADLCHSEDAQGDGDDDPVAGLLRSGPPARWYARLGTELHGHPVLLTFANALCFHLTTEVGRDMLDAKGFRAHFVQDPSGNGMALVVGPRASALKGDLMQGPDGASRKRQASVPTYLALFHLDADAPVGKVEVWREGYGTHKASSSDPVEEELECLEAVHAFLLAVALRGFL